MTRSSFLVLLLALFTHGGQVSDADAHLSMIRQGSESANLRESGDEFGHAVATGDFNGDGYDDLATGAPYENMGLTADGGSVVISWGSKYGLTHLGAVYLTASIIGGTSQANAQFGFALVSADFDNDGYADLIVGAPGETIAGNVDAGRIYALRGDSTGLALHATYTQSSVGETVEAGDRWGESLAAGNWNTETLPYMDLAVGSPGENSQDGMVAQFFGSTLFFLTPNTTLFRLSSFGIVAAPGDRFGHTLAAGNMFGDARDDLAVSAPGRTISGNNVAGSVHLLRGTTTGLAVSGLSTLTAAYFDNVQVGGLFGEGMAAGRFFGGSFDGLAVGEPGKTFGARQYTGRVLVFRGGTLGFGTGIQVRQTNCGGTELSNELFGTELAAGTFGDAAATYEDLAVGWPNEIGSPSVPDAGAVAILNGGANGPTGNYGWAAFDQVALNEIRSTGDRLGASVAFGRFDDSDKAALVVGAPGEEDNSGLVHIIAPWRQRYGLSCRNSVVTDCDGNLVFTQKPFDRVYIASTTKTMTTLLAAERTALPSNHPKHMDLDDDYLVPYWVYADIPGSQVPLDFEETMSLRHLMWTCMFMSGNDAAYAIADLCEGSDGFDISVPVFIQAMNDKAQALGMLDTHFNNPAGVDEEPVGPELGEHYSTPYDMMLLSRAAMDNPIVAEIAGSRLFVMTRRFGIAHDLLVTFYNIFRGVLYNSIQPLNGIKGGETPLAQGTGLFSVTAPGYGNAVITTFFTQEGGNYKQDAAHLAEVGLAECNYVLTATDPPYTNLYLGEFDTCLDCVSASGLELSWGAPGDRMFLMARTSGPGALNARLELQHLAEMTLGDLQTVPVGLSPFQEHGAVILRNMSTTPQTIEVLPSAGGTATVHTIPAQSFVTLPPWTSPMQLGSFTLSFTNLTGARDPAHIQVEIPFKLDVTLNPPGPFGGGQVPVTLLRNAALFSDAADLRVTGLDATGAGRLTVVVKEPTAVSGVGEPLDPSRPEPPIMHVTAGPNPFTGSVRIAFELRQAGRVGAQVFDAQGRRVRTIAAGAFEPGAQNLAWDGRDDEGEPTALGIYFARLELDDRPVGTLKLVRTK